MKIKFNSYAGLSLKKMLIRQNITKLFRSVFHEGKKYYLQIFLDKCLYKLEMLECNRIDISEKLMLAKPQVGASVIFSINLIFLR